MSELIQNITDAEFDTAVKQNPKAVLVDLWAPWCGPCKMIAPLLEELAVEFSDRLQICKINIDDNRRVAAEHGVRSIPTLLLYKNGKLADTIIGSVDKTTLVNFITPHL